MPNGTAYRLRRHTLNFNREGYAVALKFQTKHKIEIYGINRNLFPHSRLR